MTQLDEKDLAAIAKIQELRGCTRDWARQSYRQQCQKLANPDAENRSEIILEGVMRSKPAAVAAAPKKPTRNERRLAAKQEKQAKSKSPRTPKAVEKPVEPTREVPLEHVGEEYPYVYVGELFGKKHAVVRAEINHDKEGASGRFGFVSVSERRLEIAAKYAKDSQLPIAIAVTVRVKGRIDQGYAIPLKAFEEFKLKSKNAVTLSAKAREAYATSGWNDCKFVEAKTQAKAA